MKYQVNMNINKPMNEVVSLYTNKKSMLQWEPGLKEIKENKGQLFETGSEGILVFEYDKKQMNMKTYVESNQLPKQITIVYEMMGTWNRCINNFKEKNGMTAWEMDVEFRFNKPTEIPIEQFIEKTTQGMNIFKTFVEQK